MNTNISIRRLVMNSRSRTWAIAASGLFACPTLGIAQHTPAARLLPPVPSPIRTLVRAAAPDAGIEDYSVPAQAYRTQFMPPRTTLQSTPASIPTADNQTWFKNTVTGVRDVVMGKSDDVGTSQQGFVPHGMTYAGGQVAPAAATPSVIASSPPAPGKTYAAARPATVAPPQMDAVPPSPPPGVYAGPPAYRWYGWGSTTPGANPYSPNGQYPQGSANWHVQTGTTPGAFPIPVTLPARGPMGAEQPAYAGVPLPMPLGEPTIPQVSSYTRVQSEHQPSVASTPLPIPVPPMNVAPRRIEKTYHSPAALPVVSPRPIAVNAGEPVSVQPMAVVPQASFEAPSQITLPATLTVPTGPATIVSGAPIAANTPSPTVQPVPDFVPVASPAPFPVLTPQPSTMVPSSQPIAVGQGTDAKVTDPSWQSVPLKDRAGTVVPVQATFPAPSTTPPTDGSPQWQSPPAPSSINKRTELDEQPEVITAIRDACDGRVFAVSVVRRSANKLTVGFTAPDETTARAVAADIGRLALVKKHEVNFEASVAVK